MKKTILLTCSVLILSSGILQAQQWNSITGPVAGNYYSIYFADENTGYLTGSMSDVYKTTNGGLTWTPYSAGVGYSVSFADNNTGLVSGQKKIWRTTDAGLSWDTVVFNVDNYLFDVCFATSDTVFVVGGGQTIIRSYDQGLNCTVLSSEPSTNFNGLYKACFINGKTGFVSGSNGVIKKTTDGGDNWTVCNTGTTQHIMSITSIDNNTYIAVGFNGTILKTVDAGANWYTVTSNTPSTLYDIAFYDSQNGYIVGINGTILMTSDVGESWQSVSSGTTDLLRAIYFHDPNTGFIAGWDSTLFKFVNTSDINEMPGSVPFFNINKSGNELQIEFTDNNSGIEILDISGRLISKHETGKKKYIIDISGLTSGIYLIRLRSKTDIAVKKIYIE